MAIETFTWCPRINAEADTNFRVRKAQFGDGYEQVSGDGLNTRTSSGRLTSLATKPTFLPLSLFSTGMKERKPFSGSRRSNLWVCIVAKRINPPGLAREIQP
jgi:phage-related protein